MRDSPPPVETSGRAGAQGTVSGCSAILSTLIPAERCVSIAETVLLSLDAVPLVQTGLHVYGTAGASIRGRLFGGRFVPTAHLPVRVMIDVDDRRSERLVTIRCAPLPVRSGAGTARRFEERCQAVLDRARYLMDLRLWAEQRNHRRPQPQGIGSYAIRGTLGRGGFATVYRAWDRVLEREVALKVLRPEFAAEPEYRERFLREARTLAGLRHPNLVTVYGAEEQADEICFAMELLQGPSAAQLVAGGRDLPLSRVAAIVSDVASAIDFLDAHGIVHRDVKDTNVMLTSDGRAVLMDLGVALLQGRPRLTIAGGIGTPESAAPEQIEGHDVGTAVDIYALGVLAYELLAGRLPFTGELAHVLYAQVNVPPPPLQALRPDLPKAVYAAVDAALAKEPAMRPATAGALVRLMAGS